MPNVGIRVTCLCHDVVMHTRHMPKTMIIKRIIPPWLLTSLFMAKPSMVHKILRAKRSWRSILIHHYPPNSLCDTSTIWRASLFNCCFMRVWLQIAYDLAASPAYPLSVHEGKDVEAKTSLIKKCDILYEWCLDMDPSYCWVRKQKKCKFPRFVR